MRELDVTVHYFEYILFYSPVPGLQSQKLDMSPLSADIIYATLFFAEQTQTEIQALCRD